jgi:hypothetical protein
VAKVRSTRQRGRRGPQQVALGAGQCPGGCLIKRSPSPALNQKRTFWRAGGSLTFRFPVNLQLTSCRHLVKVISLPPLQVYDSAQTLNNPDTPVCPETGEVITSALSAYTEAAKFPKISRQHEFLLHRVHRPTTSLIFLALHKIHSAGLLRDETPDLFYHSARRICVGSRE